MKSGIFSDTFDTDISLIRENRNYDISKKMLERRWTPPYTLKNGCLFDMKEQKEAKIDGQYEFVVYRDHNKEEVKINIGYGAVSPTSKLASSQSNSKYSI